MEILFPRFSRGLEVQIEREIHTHAHIRYRYAIKLKIPSLLWPLMEREEEERKRGFPV